MDRLMAKAQIRLPTRKMKVASNWIGFLPQISLILPQTGMQAALASRYEEAIQEYPLCDAWNWVAMVGRAVATMVSPVSSASGASLGTI
jgi:hypothetical protein